MRNKIFLVVSTRYSIHMMILRSAYILDFLKIFLAKKTLIIINKDDLSWYLYFLCMLIFLLWLNFCFLNLYFIIQGNLVIVVHNNYIIILVTESCIHK